MAVLKSDEVLRRRLLQELLTRVQRGAAVTLSVSLGTVAIAPACQVVAGYKSFEPGDGAAPHPCDVLPATSKSDEKSLAPLVLSKLTDGSCYWINKTEVTVDQYSRFLTGHAQPIPWDPDRCASWKTAPSDPVNETNDPCTILAKMESTPFDGAKPIRCIDWCDARAFCNWAGKDPKGTGDDTAFSMNLCGGLTDGSFVEPSDVPDQWGYACSPDGRSYVYGDTAIYKACNVGLSAGDCASAIQQSQCAPTKVASASFPSCTAPCGAVDMIGNVAEWVLSCGSSATGVGGPDRLCQHRGGSFADSFDGERWCYAAPTDKRATRNRAIGFRCCADLTVHEKSLLK